jgi:hypothetical protein
VKARGRVRSLRLVVAAWANTVKPRRHRLGCAIEGHAFSARRVPRQQAHPTFGQAQRNRQPSQQGRVCTTFEGGCSQAQTQGIAVQPGASRAGGIRYHLHEQTRTIGMRRDTWPVVRLGHQTRSIVMPLN